MIVMCLVLISGGRKKAASVQNAQDTILARFFSSGLDPVYWWNQV